MNTRYQDATLQPGVSSPSLQVSDTSTWRIIIGLIICLGIFLRLFHYFNNRSLWIDEAYLSISLIKMGFAELATPPLEYEQKAPIGFLWAVKAMVLLFGKKEMALRLVPLLCGLAALLVYLPVTRWFLKPVGVLTAVGILALAPPLVYHAVEIKQYGSEMLATVLCLYLYIRYEGKMRFGSLLAWGLWGALILWFSYSAIFILAGMAIGVCLYYLFRREWRALFRSVIPFSMWLFSFGVNFFLFTYKHTDSEWLTTWFGLRGGFMPLPPTSAADIKWLFQAFYRFLDYPLGILWNFGPAHSSKITSLIKAGIAVISLFLWLLGMIAFFRQDKKLFWVLTLPLVLTLLASGLKLYPFYERLLVFLAPVIILFIAKGCASVSGLSKAPKPLKYVLPALLLLWPLYSSTDQVINPHLFGGKKNAAEREALFYIKDRYKEGDVVYIYWNFLHTYLYYKDAYGLTFPRTIEGSDLKNEAQSEVDYFGKMKPEFDAVTQSKRVWFIHNRMLKLNIGDFDNHPAWYFAREKEAGTMFEEKFSSMGKLVDVYQNPYLQVSLYNLNSK